MDDRHAWTVMDKILHIDYRQTDRLTEGQTLVLVKSLSRLKMMLLAKAHAFKVTKSAGVLAT